MQLQCSAQGPQPRSSEDVLYTSGETVSHPRVRREVRRAMEAENKKSRGAARREFTAAVRRLAEYCKKRDPRVARHQQEAAALEKAPAASGGHTPRRERTWRDSRRRKKREVLRGLSNL